MANLVLRVSTKYQPVKDGPRGADLGWIGQGTTVMVDLDRENHEVGRVPIVGPAGLGPTWRATGKEAWIELANTTPVNDEEEKYLLTTSKADGHVISCVRVG